MSTSETQKATNNPKGDTTGDTGDRIGSAREAAVRTLMAVTLKSRPFDVALDDITSSLDSRDRAFVMQLVMLSLRRLGSLRALMGRLVDRGLPRNATWTDAALITGLAQILLMRTADHAAVNETVTLIKNLSGKEKGFAGLVNAVLRRAVRERDVLTGVLNAKPQADLPLWLQTSWRRAYGQDGMVAIARSLQDTPPLDISLKPGEDKVVWAEKIEATLMPNGTLRRTLTDVTKLPGYDDGLWWVQDMAASLPVMLLGDVSGKHVMDMCAAPGGKTMQLASLGARVTAVDRNKNRLTRLHANMKRTGLAADVYTADATAFGPRGSVDHILLDAPCSATGTLRRNPDVTWTKSEADVEKLTSLQKRMLDHAFKLLPVGGTLVYCVCSLERVEGEEQISAFLARHENAARRVITAADIGGMAELITADGDMRCLPSALADQGGMDGFFAARIEKHN